LAHGPRFHQTGRFGNDHAPQQMGYGRDFTIAATTLRNSLSRQAVFAPPSLRSFPGQLCRVALVKSTNRGSKPTADRQGGEISRRASAPGSSSQRVQHAQNPDTSREHLAPELFALIWKRTPARTGWPLSACLAKIRLGYGWLHGAAVSSAEYEQRRGESHGRFHRRRAPPVAAAPARSLGGPPAAATRCPLLRAAVWDGCHRKNAGGNRLGVVDVESVGMLGIDVKPMLYQSTGLTAACIGASGRRKPIL
jgi:hypothetical protein